MTKYRISSWFDIEEMIPKYGIQIKLPDSKQWLNVAEDGVALFFDNETSAASKMGKLVQAIKEIPSVD